MSNGLLQTTFADYSALQSLLEAGRYGQASPCSACIFRDARPAPIYHDPWTGFSRDLNTCYSEGIFPFPPYECLARDFRLLRCNR